MKTAHQIIFGDSRELRAIPEQSVDLVVTSPPYPMIKMWDELFSGQNEEIGIAIKEGKGMRAFELMHHELNKVWKETYRSLKTGGIACINIGDATRSVGDRFQIYPNHARIVNYCLELGFHALPEILWVKETNKPDKFMGSGMLPVGAYVTLEHEHILVLRKGERRIFKSEEEKLQRLQSAFFWEERNTWFSDRWKDINGIFQKTGNERLRERSAAYPFELAYRLINMFSVQEDTILDPFLGTGTTTLAAIASARNSIGVELDPNFGPVIEERIGPLVGMANDFNQKRLARHAEFVEKRVGEGRKPASFNRRYNVPVITTQETEIRIPELTRINHAGERRFEVDYA